MLPPHYLFILCVIVFHAFAMLVYYFFCLLFRQGFLVSYLFLLRLPSGAHGLSGSLGGGLHIITSK